MCPSNRNILRYWAHVLDGWVFVLGFTRVSCVIGRPYRMYTPLIPLRGYWYNYDARRQEMDFLSVHNFVDGRFIILGVRPEGMCEIAQRI